MATVNKEWIEQRIQKEWEDPECRRIYIEAAEEASNDRSQEIAERDAILEAKRMAKTGETIK